jgi:hypothetical protein
MRTGRCRLPRSGYVWGIGADHTTSFGMSSTSSGKIIAHSYLVPSEPLLARRSNTERRPAIKSTGSVEEFVERYNSLTCGPEAGCIQALSFHLGTILLGDAAGIDYGLPEVSGDAESKCEDGPACSAP